MNETGADSLICVLCKESCAGRKYAKDKKGRIICRDCIDKRRAQKQAQAASGAHAGKASGSENAAAIPSNEGLMAGLISNSKVAHSSPCPSCQALLDDEAVVCSRCGYNKQTGKAVTTRVVAAPKEKKKLDNPMAGLGGFDPMWTVWGMGIFMSLVLVGGIFAPPAMVILLLFAFLYTLTSWILLVVDAFRSGQGSWGIMMLIPLVNIVVPYYAFAKCESPTIKAHYWLAFLFGIIAAVASQDALASLDEAAMLSPSVSPVYGWPSPDIAAAGIQQSRPLTHSMAAVDNS